MVTPTKRIVAAIKTRFPDCPIIGFPRGAGPLYERYAELTGVNAVSIDTVLPLGFARDRLQSAVPVQGNLDPALLVVGGAPMADAVRQIRRELCGGGFIFNLGHGILPETPPENVAALARLLSEPLAAD